MSKRKDRERAEAGHLHRNTNRNTSFYQKFMRKLHRQERKPGRGKKTK